MADAVQERMELQLDELHDLYRRQIFTRAEIRDIVKRRRQFEYCLRKRTTPLTDYLRFIEYELNLDALRRRRKRDLNIRKSNMPSEYAIIKRVHFIFTRALQKFKDNVSLWLQYFEFCEKTNSGKALGRAFATAIQFNPLTPGLWIKAAKWEFESNTNVAAARILLQRALRLMPKEKDLWLEYFRLEWLYLEKITKRLAVLKIDPATVKPLELQGILQQHESEAESSDSESDVESDDDDEYGVGKKRKQISIQLPQLSLEQEQMQQDDGPKIMDPFLRGDIPRLIFQNAKKAIPDDVSFLLSFLPVCRLYRNSKLCRDEIYAALGDSAAAVAARCRRPFEDRLIDDGPISDVLSAVTRVSADFKTAIQSRHNDGALVEEFVAWLCDQLRECNAESDSDVIEYLSSAVLEACKSSFDAGQSTPTLRCLWVDQYLARVEVTEAIATATAILKKHADPVVWERRIRIEMAVAPGAGVVTLMDEAIKALSASEKSVDAVVQLKLDWLITHASPAEVHKAFSAATKAATGAEAERLMEQHVDWSFSVFGIDGARKIYDKILPSVVRPSLGVLRRCIQLEEATRPVNQSNVRRLYDRATREYGADHIDLWLEFLRFELQQGEIQRVTTLHSRALKSVNNPQLFTSRYNDMKLYIS